MQLAPAVNFIIETLASAGFPAFAVGGCVRDMLLGKIPADWDIATAATPVQIQAVFADETTLPSGIAHGTITLVLNEIPYEITAFRADGPYSDGRRPDRVFFGASLEDDLARRDFTINAMAFSETAGLIDPFGGQKDLAAGKIVCVGDPHRRFSEDFLRILRAARFASVLDFTLAENTKQAAFALRGNLQNVAVERKTEEILKFLAGKAPGKTWFALFELLQAALPLLPPPSPAIAAALEHAQHRPALSLALLCGNAVPGAVFSALRLPKALENPATTIAFWLNTPQLPTETIAVRRFLAQVSKQEAADILEGWRLLAKPGAAKAAAVTAEIFARKDCLSVDDLALSGKDLQILGFPPGKAIGAAKAKLFEVVLEGFPNEKSRLLQAAKELLENFM